MIFYAWFLCIVAIVCIACGGFSFWAHERVWLAPQGDPRLERWEKIAYYAFLITLAICLLLCFTAPIAYWWLA